MRGFLAPALNEVLATEDMEMGRGRRGVFEVDGGVATSMGLWVREGKS